MRCCRFGILAILGLLFHQTPQTFAEVYNVGNGQVYQQIGQVPWESLAPGDTVSVPEKFI